MTPEEKAKELVDACFRYAKGQTTESRMINAKCLALIAVLIVVKQVKLLGEQTELREPLIWWQRIEQEIHKL